MLRLAIAYEGSSRAICESSATVYMVGGIPPHLLMGCIDFLGHAWCRLVLTSMMDRIMLAFSGP
jgi:hypothetical protein